MGGVIYGPGAEAKPYAVAPGLKVAAVDDAVRHATSNSYFDIQGSGEYDPLLGQDVEELVNEYMLKTVDKSDVDITKITDPSQERYGLLDMSSIDTIN